MFFLLVLILLLMPTRNFFPVWFALSLLRFRLPARLHIMFFFFFQAEDGIRDVAVTGVQTCCSSDLEGLDVRTVLITGGPTAMAALVGGGVDYTLVAGVAAVRAIAQNAPMTIISGMQPYMDYTLIGAKGINGVNDLKGKVVGVTGPGGIAEFAAIEGLSRKGLVRDRDYKILYGVGNSPSRAQALETGKIQASPFSFLERLELERKGFSSLFDIGSVMPGFPFVVIVTSKQKIETDPEGIVAMLR